MINFLCPREPRFLPQAKNQRTLTHLKHFITRWCSGTHHFISLEAASSNVVVASGQALGGFKTPQVTQMEPR